MAEKEIEDILARPDPCTDRVNPCFSWQVIKHPTVVHKDGSYCPITNEDLYSLIKGNMTDNSHNLDISTTAQVDSSFFNPDPQSDHVELEYYCTRTYIGVSSKEYHTTAKDISMENVEQFIGKRNIESLSEEEFDNFLQEQLKEVDLSDQLVHVLRKKPETFKNPTEEDAFDGASRSVPSYSRQDTLTKRLTGQGYVQIEQDHSPTRAEKKEKRASKISKSELKKQSELKRSQCQPLLDKLESIEKHLKYLLSLIKNNPDELRSSRREYEILVNDYEMLELETEKIRKDWSSLPPVEGDDLMRDIDELHATIRMQMEAINSIEFDEKPPMKYGKEKSIQDIRIECQSLYDQLVQLKLLWSHYWYEQPLDSKGWQTKRRNIEKVQANMEELRKRFESLTLKANQENISLECKEPFNDFIDFYKTFHAEFTIYLINFYKEEFTKFPQAGSNQEKARDTKSILCQVYIVRLKELQISLEELMKAGAGDSIENKKQVEELRKEMSLVKRGIDALDKEWLGVEVGHADPVEDLSKQFDKLSHKLDEARIKIFEPPQKTKNLTKEEKVLATETKKFLFQPYLDKLHVLKQQLLETINFTVEHESTEEIFVREKKIQKLSKDIEDSKRQLEQLELKWKDVPVEGLNTEFETENIFKDINTAMKRIPKNPDGSLKLVSKETLPSDKVVSKEEKAQDIKIKYEELFRKLEELRKLWMGYTAQHPKDERDWQLKKKNIERIQSDLDDLKKEFVELRTGVNVEWEVGEEDPSIQFEEMYSSFQDDYTSYLIPFVKEEFIRFPQTKPNQEKAREAKSILCQAYIVKMKELQISLDELMRTGGAESTDTKRKVEGLRKEMTSVKKGIDALETEWVGVEVGHLDPVEDLSKQFDQLSHKMEENRVKIYKPPQKTKNFTKEEKAVVTETKKSLFQPYLDKVHLLKQQLVETINFSSENETAEEILIRQNKIQKLTNELKLTKNQIDQISLEWKEVPVESLNFEAEIDAIYGDTITVLNKIPKDADGNFVIKKTVDVKTSGKPPYQNLLDKLSELNKQLQNLKEDKGDGSKKTREKNNKKAKEIEKEIESLKKSLDKKDPNWRAYKVEGFDPFSNIGSIFGDLGHEDYVNKDDKVGTGETKQPESNIKAEIGDRPNYQNLLDRLSQISLEKDALSKETPKDNKLAKQKDKKLKELETEVESLVRKLDKTDINWRIHPVTGFDAQSNIRLFSIFGDSSQEENKDSLQTNEQKMNLVKIRNEQYGPLLEKLSALQKKWNELGMEILPKKSKLKKVRETEIKEIEYEMDKVKEELSQLDEKWRSFEIGVDPDTVDPVKAVSDLFLTLQSQLVASHEPEQSEDKSIEQKETLYKPLIDRMSEIAIEVENTMKQLTLSGQDEKVLFEKKDRLKQLKEESDQLTKNLEALELEWKDIDPEEINVPIVGTSVTKIQNPSLILKKLQEKIGKSFDQIDESSKSKVTKTESEEVKISEKTKAYDPLLNKYYELEAKLVSLSKPESVTSEEQLQVRVEEIQKLEKEIGDVKKSMDALDLEWKGVKVGDVDPIPPTSDLVKKFNDSVQTIKLKLPKKEDIVKQKGEMKKKAYDPLLNKYYELEAKLVSLSKPESVTSEEQLQVRVEEIQKLEKEIGDVKKSMDSLDLEWKGVKVGDVDLIPPTSDLVKKFNESVQTIKLKLPKKEDIVKQKAELKKKAYDPLLMKFHELEAKLTSLSKPESIKNEEQLQGSVNEIQKLEKEIGEIKNGMDALDIEWKGVKVDTDILPNTSDLVSKFCESVDSFKLKLPRKEDLVKQSKANIEKANGRDKLAVYDPFLKDLKQLQLEINECGFLSPVDPNLIRKKFDNISDLENRIKDAQNSLDMLEMKWMGREAKFEPGTTDPALDAMQKLKKLKDEFHAVKTQAEKPKPEVYSKKVEIYKPFKTKLDELIKKLNDLMTRDDVQQKFDALSGLEVELKNVTKEISDIDEVWKDIPITGVDPSLEVSNVLNSLSQQILSSKSNLDKEKDKHELSLNKEKAYQPVSDKLSSLETSFDSLSKSIGDKKDVKELEEALKKAKEIKKELDSPRKMLDTLESKWKDIPSVTNSEDIKDKSLKIVGYLDGGLNKLIKDVEGKLKIFQDETHLAKQDFMKEVESLENIIGSPLPWDGLENYQQLNKAFIHDQLDNVQTLESNVDAGLKKLETVFSQTTQKLQDINSPLSLKEKDAIKKSFDGWYDSIGKLKKKLEQKKNQLNSQLQSKNSNLEKNTPTDKCFNELQSYFADVSGSKHADAEKPTHFVETVFALENPDTWKIIEQHDKVLSMQLKSDLQESVRLLKQIETEANNPSIKSSLNDIQVINQEKASTMSPDIHSSMNQINKLKPSSWKFHIPLDFTSKLTWLGHNLHELKGKLSSDNQSVPDLDALAKEASSLQQLIYQTSKPLTECMDRLRMDVEVGSEIDPKKVLKSLEEIKKLKASLDSINNDLEQSLQTKLPKISSNLYSDASTELEGHVKKLEKDLHSMPNNKAEADKIFTETLKTKLENIEASLKSFENGYDQHLALPIGKRSPSKLKDLTNNCDEIESSVDGVRKILKFKLSSDPSFSQHLNLSPNINLVELRLKNAKNKLNEETAKSPEGDVATISSHMDEYKNLLHITEATLKDDNIKSIVFKDPQQLERKIHFLQNLLKDLESQMDQVDLSINQAPPSLQQNLKNDKKQLDDMAKTYLDMGYKQFNLWSIYLSSWKDLLPHLQQLEQQVLDKQKKAKVDEASIKKLNPKELNGKLKQLTEIKRDLENDRPKLLKVISEAWRLLNVFHVPTLKSSVRDLQKSTDFEDQVNEAISKIENEMKDRNKLDALIKDYNLSADGASKGLSSAKKLLNKKSPTFEDVDKIQGLYQDAKKDLHEATKLKAEMDKVAQNLLSLKPDDNLESKLTKLDDGLRKLLNDSTEVEEKLGFMAPLAISKSQALSKLEDWLDHADRSLKEDEDTKKLIKTSEAVKTLVDKYKALDSDLPLQKALLSILGFTLSAPIDSVSSGAPRFPEIDSSVDSFDEGLGESLEPSGTASPEESLECFKKFNSISKSIEDRFSSLVRLESDVDSLENGVKELEKWIEEDAVKKYSELESDLKKLHVEHLPYQVHEFEECLKNKKKQLSDLSITNEGMNKMTWPDTSAFIGKVQIESLKSRLNDLDRKLLEFNKGLENKSRIVDEFDRHHGDCKNLNKATKIQLQRLSQISDISGWKSYSSRLDDLKNLQKSYKKDSDDNLKKLSDVVTQLHNVCDVTTNNDVDKVFTDIKSANSSIMSDITKSIDEGGSLLQNLKNINELYDRLEKFADEKDKIDISLPLNDVLSKSINEDAKHLESMCKELEGMKNELIKKINKETATNFFKRKSPINSKASSVIKKLKNYLDGKTDNTSKTSDLHPVLDDLEVFLSEKLEPKLSSLDREKLKNAVDMKRALDGFNSLSQEMDGLSLKLHAANESDVDGPIEASAKDKLIKLNARWNGDRKKLFNLITALQDRLALLQNFSERCKEWEKYLTEVQKEFSAQKQPGNLESCLELQGKIKSFLEQVPSRHSILQTLKSDADELSNDIPSKRSFQTKLDLLEEQWKNLIDQMKKKELATDGFVLLWRQYQDSKCDTSKIVKGLENKLEGVLKPGDLSLSSVSQVKDILENCQETLTSIEPKHFKDLKSFSDQLVPISNSKTAKELNATVKDLTTQKEKLRMSLESSVDTLRGVMVDVEDFERRISDYQKMLDSSSEEAKKPLPKAYDAVIKEKSNLEKLIHNLEQEKTLQDIDKQKNALKGRGMFNQDSISLLKSKIKHLKTGRDVVVDLLNNKFSELQSYLNKWSDFDGLHGKVDKEISEMNGVVDGGEKVHKHNLKDLLEFYTTDFKNRLTNLKSPVDELDQIGNQLKTVSNDPLKSKIEVKLKDIHDKQKALVDKTGRKTKRLEDAYKKLNQFNDEVPKLEEWLSSVEHILCSLPTFETTQPAEIEKHAKVLQATEKDVNSKSTSFQELSKLADYLSSNQDACSTKIEARSITKIKDDLLKRWSVLQNLLPHRNHFLSDTESNWDAYKKMHAEFNSWLDSSEKELQNIIPKTNKYGDAKSARDHLKKFLDVVQKKSSDLKKLNLLYGSLVNKQQIDKKGELKQLNVSDNKRWNELNAAATGELRRLDNLVNMRDDFNSKASALENFMKGLINNLEQAARSDQKKVKVRTSTNARNELKRKAKQLENFEDSAKYLLEKVDPSEKEEVSSRADHVRDLHEKVKELLMQMSQDKDGEVVDDVMQRDDKAGRGWFFGKSVDDEEEESGELGKLRQLEMWLDHAEGILLKDKFRPITLQGFKEALKTFRDLDNEIESWKPDVVEIRHSAPNVAQQTPKSEKLCSRISDGGHRWDEVCLRNKTWGDSLDSILLDSDFLRDNMDDLDDLLKRLTSELKKISDTPVDDSTPDLKIRQLSRDLTLVEHGLDKVKPNLATLRQLHNLACSSPDYSTLPPERTSQLNEVGKHLDELETKLGFLSDGCLEERARLNRAKADRPNFKEDEEWDALEEMDLGPVSSPSYWKNLISRGCKTALPIQVLMLLLLGFASIVPVCDPDCFSGAIYSYNGGPPPT